MNPERLDAQLLDLMLRAGSAWVLYLLLILSLLGVAVILERLWYFGTARRSAGRIEAALGALRSGDRTAAGAALSGLPSLEAAVARTCLEFAQDGAAAVEEHVASSVERGRLRAERGLAFLGTLGSNAPFVGLFGTVLGIIRAFHDLSANSVQGTQAVMAGIAEALVATGVGLMVALPAVAAYNAFTRRVETEVSHAQATAHAFLAFIKTRPPSESR